MLAALSVELRKLNRSLAAVLAVAAPSLIAIFAFFNLLSGFGYFKVRWLAEAG